MYNLTITYGGKMSKFKSNKVILSIFMLSNLISYTALAQNVAVRGVRLTGSGCDAATASAATTSDGKILSVLFDNYIAEIGQGSSNPQSTSLKKNCTVFIDVDVPMGYQYALSQTEYRGFTAMPASAFGLHRFTQIIPNQMIPSLREAQLRGPLNQNYSVIVKQKPGREVYSTCNNVQQTIQLLSELQIAYLPNTSDRSIAMINLDSVDTGVNSRFSLVWRKCR
jgi:hypothetical protein